ncbi:hypothetical protein Ga0123462_1616 [Mariprofundus ferrinatatus]|uniref:Uncharacterized protein n=1 Tax=Mariprofundus ferrinatatus TaxID=1921087 RepID=A0A2K8LC49_9PROT|nr:hypothetical protein [Mariprofundus ferrinatatus]ATX82474.1 hypothetical protein Ga0123462_1616 [Mariprofundus ferrinatatus]
MMRNPGPLAPLCMTAAFITPPVWAVWFLVAACLILAIAIFKLLGLPADHLNVTDRLK